MLHCTHQQHRRDVPSSLPPAKTASLHSLGARCLMLCPNCETKPTWVNSVAVLLTDLMSKLHTQFWLLQEGQMRSTWFLPFSYVPWTDQLKPEKLKSITSQEHISLSENRFPRRHKEKKSNNNIKNRRSTPQNLTRTC